MKKLILISSLIFILTNLKSQNYQISFVGQGASAAVDSVIVENLMQNTNLKLGGNQILLLEGVVSINDINANDASALKIYPNPFSESCSIEFEAPVSGNAVIKLCDITGKEIAKSEYYLQQGNNIYQISGIKKGIYYVQISSETYSYNGKLINNNISYNGITKITFQNIKNETPAIGQKASIKKAINAKETASIIQMQYNTGDRLKLTGISGAARKYRTVYMLIPTSSQTVTFNFVSCTDADSNNYSVVQIGSQLWMAENLKTTKYNNGISIPTSWDSMPSYAWYNNNINFKNSYGALYNWYAVDTVSNGGKNICPEGWHVPTDIEWSQLITNLIDIVAGGKLKETGTTHWNSPNTGATNETGFTALPIGYRTNYGTFFSNGSYGYWWSATKIDKYYAWIRTMLFNGSYMHRHDCEKTYGYSVRCIKD